MRLDFSKEEGYQPHWHVSRERAGITEALNEENYELAEKRAKLWLSSYPVDAGAHYWLASALASRGERAESTKHYAYFYGLLSSLFTTGDGLSQETALQVISTGEEYLVIDYLGGRYGPDPVVGARKMHAVRPNGARSRWNEITYVLRRCHTDMGAEG